MSEERSVEVMSIPVSAYRYRDSFGPVDAFISIQHSLMHSSHRSQDAHAQRRKFSLDCMIDRLRA